MQEKVLEILKKKDKFMIVREIRAEFRGNVSRNSVDNALRILSYKNLIKVKMRLDGNRPVQSFKYKKEVEHIPWDEVVKKLVEVQLEIVKFTTEILNQARDKPITIEKIKEIKEKKEEALAMVHKDNYGKIYGRFK